MVFVGREILSSPIEGHHIASRSIIEAASSIGIGTKILSIESKTKESKNADTIIVNSNASFRENFSFLGGMFSAFDDFFSSVKSLSQIKYLKSDLIHVLNVNKEAYILIHHLLGVKKPLLFHFFHSPAVLADDIFLIRNIAFKSGVYGRLFNNHAITANFSLYRYFIEKLGADKTHVHYAPYPIKTNLFKPLNNKEELRKKYGLPTERPIIVYVGSLDPARGIFNLLKAAPYIAEKFPNVLIYISYLPRRGEEAYEKYLYYLMHILKLENSVTIRGPSAKIEEVYNLADIVVLPFMRPYWVDPPLVLLEAMSSGAAVISASVGAIKEVIRDSENAILTKAQDPCLIAESITNVLENPDASRKMGQKARDTILRNYSYETVGKRLLKTYNSVLDHL